VLEYTPGKLLFTADALSRAVDSEATPNSDSTMEDDIDVYVNMVMTSLPITTTSTERIKEETSKDHVMLQLMKTVMDGWPVQRQQCPKEIQDFWNYRDEMSVVEGLVLKGNRLVIPESLQKEMLQQIHKGHFGMEKCRRRARQVMFWPGLNADIDNMVSACSTCVSNKNKQQSEPLKIHEVPQVPWEKVGIDLFTVKGKEYIAVVDYYSQYIEIYTLHSTTSKAVINAVKSMFSRHGTPVQVISDNGPQFSSQEFKEFSKVWDFNHQTSSPHYPASNGQAENAVKIMKNMIKKVASSGEDVYQALQVYRSTPLEHGKSPAELLFNRRIRSNLPVTKKLLENQVPSSNVENKKKELKKRQKQNYDKNVAPLPKLKVGATVRLQNMEKPSSKKPQWPLKGVVTKVLQNRSYLVKTENGDVLRRNRRHLLETAEPVQQDEWYDAEEELPATDEPALPDQPEQLAARNDQPAADQPAAQPVRRSSRVSKPNPKYSSDMFAKY